MITMLDNWMSGSITNFNLIVGITTMATLVSLGVLLWVWKQFGRPDERTNGIFLKITGTMFLTAMIVSALFIGWVDKDIHNFRQIYLIMQSFIFIVGAVYSVILYLKDFKS